MPELNDDTLQRLFDEELDDTEAEALREALEASPDDQARLESLGQMRAMLRAAVDAEADAVDLDGLWPAVRAEISSPGPESAWARFTAWLGGSMGAHPLRWAAAGACMVALAVLAGVLIASSPEHPVTPAGQIVNGDEPHGNGNLDIERIEFKNRHPDIFKIKDGKSSTTVIWIYPDEDDDDDTGVDTDDAPTNGGPI